MKTSCVVGIVLTALAGMAFADNSKDQAITKERKQIEGVWRVVAIELGGRKAMEEDARKITVVIGSDGSWNLNIEDYEVSQGTSTLDPDKNPKAIDFRTGDRADGKGEQSLGIYEVTENTLKFCVALSGKGRPSEFSSVSGSEQILITLERVKAK